MDSLFPNPAIAQLNVMINAPKQDDIILLITDINGRLVLQKKTIAAAGSNTIPINIIALVNGTYFLKIISASGNKSVIGKFTKQ